MKSITIHNLDDELEALILKKAKEQGLSLNKTIKNLLRKSLGLDGKNDNKHDFIDLFGIWTKDDEDEFLEKTSDLAKIDKEDWA